MDPGRLVFRVHAIRRMAEHDISVPEVRAILESGEVIETYVDEATTAVLLDEIKNASKLGVDVEVRRYAA